MYDLGAPEDDVSPEVVLLALLVLFVLFVLWLPFGDSESLDSMRSEISTMSAVGPTLRGPARKGRGGATCRMPSRIRFCLYCSTTHRSSRAMVGKVSRTRIPNCLISELAWSL